jgi:hypothetical protein
MAILNVGPDHTVWADFEVQLCGSFTAASFTLSGGNIRL